MLSRCGLTPAEHLEVRRVDETIVGGHTWRSVFMVIAVIAAVWRRFAIGSVTVRTGCGANVCGMGGVAEGQLLRLLVVHDDRRAVAPGVNVSLLYYAPYRSAERMAYRTICRDSDGP